MKNKLRKVIKEEIAKMLDEDYQSIQDIKNFANDIISYLGKKNLPSVIKWQNNINEIILRGATLKEVYQSFEKKYEKLDEFIYDTNIFVDLMKAKDKSVKGRYATRDSKFYNKYLEREIILYYGDNFLENIQTKVNDCKEKNVNITAFDIYSTLYYALTSTLIHELQHAYDDYRSKNKMYQTKEWEEFKEKYSEEKQLGDWDEEQIKIKKYLNLTHEIWARFSQAISNTIFTDADFVKDENGKSYIKREMKPLEKVVKDFRYKYDNWNALANSEDNINLSDIQKRLIKAVVQFWHLEQEKLKTQKREYFD